MTLVFWMLSFKPAFSLSSFTFIRRLFSSSSLSAIRVVSSAYLRLLIFLPAILILACASWYCYWVHSMKRVDSVTISFPQKNDLPLTNNPGERNESIKQAILFCSHNHKMLLIWYNLWCSSHCSGTITIASQREFGAFNTAPLKDCPNLFLQYKRTHCTEQALRRRSPLMLSFQFL